MPNKRVVGQGGEKERMGNRTVIFEVYLKLGESAADIYPDVTASSRTRGRHCGEGSPMEITAGKVVLHKGQIRKRIACALLGFGVTELGGSPSR